MLKRVFLVAALTLLCACNVRPPSPPKPPAPPQFRLQVYVLDNTEAPMLSARVYRDNQDKENPFKGGTPIPVGPDAGAAWDLPGQDFNICGLQDGYVATKDGSPIDCEPVPLHAGLTVKMHLSKVPDPPPPPPVVGWTHEQLVDLQGDLMIWAPEVGCQTGETGIHCDASGLQAGWVWSVSIPRYSAAHRAQLYSAIKARGYTHVAIDVNACVPNDPGYHNLYPTGDCSGFDNNLNTTLKELWSQNLIPVCAGLGVPDLQNDQVAPGLDRSLCPIVIDDWDNDHKKDCRIKHLAETFPKALIYVEMPQGVNPSGQWQPGPDSCSDVPFPSSGGEWIRNNQKRYPNFTGVLYEVTAPDGQAAILSDLNNWNPWFRDLQQVLFESDTYWKFWSHMNVDDEQKLNDGVRAAAPWVKGYFSGGTSHPAPVPQPAGDGHYDGELQGDQVQVVNAPDFRSWPVTTSLDSVTFGPDDMYLKFDAQDRWPNVSFGIQYSIGLCVKKDQWYCNAPIELWQGKPGGGGQVQDDNVDGSGIGQVAKNWWYASRWGTLNGYQPKAGEQVGVFVVAGDARNNISNPQERSNIVLVKFPAKGQVLKYTK